MAFYVLAVGIFCLVQLTLQDKVCPAEVEKVGCFRDWSRPLDKLVIYRRRTMRELRLNVSLPRLLCDCAVEARSHNFTYIGLQFYAECWSSNDTWPEYDRDGPSEDCVDKDYDKCDEKDVECVGPGLTNFVYKIVQSPPDSGLSAKAQVTSPTLLQVESTSLPPPTSKDTEPTSVTLPPTTKKTEPTSVTLPPTTKKTEPTSVTLPPTTKKAERTPLTLPPTTKKTKPTSVTSPSDTKMTEPTTVTSPPTTEGTETTSVTEPHTTGTPCTDKQTFCSKNKIYCRDEYPHMFKECPKTCGVC